MLGPTATAGGNDDEVRDHVALLLMRESDGRRRCTPVREILKGRGGLTHRMRSMNKKDIAQAENRAPQRECG